MKKLALTLTILFGMTLGASAQGGLFGYGAVSDENYYGAYSGGRNSSAVPLFPSHGQIENQTAPLGSGIAIFIGFGAAYLMGKKRKEK